MAEFGKGVAVGVGQSLVDTAKEIGGVVQYLGNAVINPKADAQTNKEIGELFSAVIHHPGQVAGAIGQSPFGLDRQS